MLTTIAFVFAALYLFLLWKKQRHVFFAAFFILFGLIYRIIDVTYLDLFGPVYAIELERYVGGNGAAPAFILSCFAFLLPLTSLLRRDRLVRDIAGRQTETTYHIMIRKAAFVGLSALVLFLYVDMLRIGTIPLFSGMDRLEYSRIAGYLHGPAYEMNFLISATIGVFAFLPRLFGKQYSLSCIGLMIALLCYWALTGNRFSPFFVTLSFFFIPYAAIVAMESAGTIRRETTKSVWSVLISSRVLLLLGGVAASVAIVGLLFNSYYEVRNYADPFFHIKQRILVQPIQIWASTWDTIRFGLTERVNWLTIDQVLINPARPEGNTTIYYLMERELGFFRAEELIDAGQQYAGGYPEIFFLLFGVLSAIPLLLIFGITTVLALYCAVRSFGQGRPLTCIMALYVFYGFSLCYIGGMLNFIIAPTFLVKFTLLWVIWLMEKYFIAREPLSVRGWPLTGRTPHPRRPSLL